MIALDIKTMATSEQQCVFFAVNKDLGSSRVAFFETEPKVSGFLVIDNGAMPRFVDVYDGKIIRFKGSQAAPHQTIEFLRSMQAIC